MSANVDLVLAFFAALENDDLPWMAQWVHPKVELVIADGPEPGACIGLARAAEHWREYLSTWEDCRVAASDLRDLDSARVLLLQRFSGRGKTRVNDVRRRQYQRAGIFQILNGKVGRVLFYWNGEHALADLGLASDAVANRPE
jgi:hypothetical protein